MAGLLSAVRVGVGMAWGWSPYPLSPPRTVGGLGGVVGGEERVSTGTVVVSFVINPSSSPYPTRSTSSSPSSVTPVVSIVFESFILLLLSPPPHLSVLIGMDSDGCCVIVVVEAIVVVWGYVLVSLEWTPVEWAPVE